MKTKGFIAYLSQRFDQLLVWVVSILGAPAPEAPPELALSVNGTIRPRQVHWLDAPALSHWPEVPLDFDPCVVYDDVQSEFTKGETNLLTKTTTKNVVATKAGARWEVVNLKTDKTVKFAKSRDAARAIRATYAKPTAYGIYDTVSQKFVR